MLKTLRDFFTHAQKNFLRVISPTYRQQEHLTSLLLQMQERVSRETRSLEDMGRELADLRGQNQARMDALDARLEYLLEHSTQSLRGFLEDNLGALNERVEARSLQKFCSRVEEVTFLVAALESADFVIKNMGSVPCLHSRDMFPHVLSASSDNGLFL